MQRFVILFFMLTLLSACALEPEFTPQRCTSENWYNLGLSKGMNGLSLDSYERIQSTCAQYGIAINGNAYRSGWERGIRSYCANPNNAYQLGSSGQPMPNFCPGDMNALFYAAYQNGQSSQTQQSQQQRYEQNTYHRHTKNIKTEKITEKVTERIIYVTPTPAPEKKPEEKPIEIQKPAEVKPEEKPIEIQKPAEVKPEEKPIEIEKPKVN